jgi:hypothetical protein
MDKHLAVHCFLFVPLSNSNLTYGSDTCPKIFQHEVPARVCRKRSFPCREAGHQGSTLCYLLCPRRYERQASRAVGIWLSHSNVVSRIIGFEELGNVDSFSTATLELRLLHTGQVLSYYLNTRL